MGGDGVRVGTMWVRADGQMKLGRGSGETEVELEGVRGLRV